MRVISGKYGGRKLKSLPGQNTRPTSDKVKESLFNIIGPYFNGGQSLDLYAGSGGLSIEAVSRGIDRAVLFEKNRSAAKIIQENIEISKEPNRFKLILGDSQKKIKSLQGEGKFDLVFIDPPYAKQDTLADVERLLAEDLLSDRAMVICELGKDTKLPDKIGPLKIWKEKVYGASTIYIYLWEE